ncbi:MAG: hypothetical protein WA063_05385 [Minisyncoccia bacterium]
MIYIHNTSFIICNYILYFLLFKSRQFGEILARNKYTGEKRNKILQIVSECLAENFNALTSFEAKLLSISEQWDWMGQAGVERAFIYCKQKRMSEADTARSYIEKIKEIAPIFLELIKKTPEAKILIKDIMISLLFVEELEKKQ